MRLAVGTVRINRYHLDSYKQSNIIFCKNIEQLIYNNVTKERIFVLLPKIKPDYSCIG